MCLNCNAVSLALIVISLIALGSSAPAHYDAYHYGHGSSEDARDATNVYVEDIIAAFRHSIGAKLDPLRVPTQHVSFDRRFLGIRFHGELLAYHLRTFRMFAQATIDKKFLCYATQYDDNRKHVEQCKCEFNNFSIKFLSICF